jgi:putative transposase
MSGPGGSKTPWKLGSILTNGGKTFRIAKLERHPDSVGDDASADRVHIENMADGRIVSCPVSKLEADLAARIVWLKAGNDPMRLLNLGELPQEVSEALDNLPPTLRTEAVLRDFICKSVWLLRLRRKTKDNLRPSRLNPTSQLIKELEFQYRDSPLPSCPFNDWTLYKADLAERKSGPTALIPNYHLRGGPGVKRLDERVESIISDELKKLEDNKKKKIVTPHIETAINGRIESLINEGQHLKHVSTPTVKNRIGEVFTQYEINVRRYGKKRADKIFRNSQARMLTLNALDIVHYDDKDTAIFLVDDKLRLPWGRCHLTAGVDEATTMPMGKSISERERDSVSAFSAVMDGIYPKNPADPQFALCKHQWRTYGQHGLIILDNASYNASKSTLASLLELEAEIEFARAHTPTDKTVIEHFFHILMIDFIANLPGWVGPKQDREMIDHGLDTSVMDKTNFIQRMNKWMVDVYPFLPKDSKNPLCAFDRWQLEYETISPSLPERRPMTDLVKGMRTTLRCRDSGGFMRQLLRYNNDTVAMLRRKYGRRAEFSILYLLDRLDYIYIQDPQNQLWYRVGCTDDSTKYEGLSDYQWTLLRKMWRWMGHKGNPNLTQIGEAREKLMDVTDQLRFSKKMSERKKGEMLKSGLVDEKTRPAASKASKKTTVMVSDLERMTKDLEEMDLEVAD